MSDSTEASPGTSEGPARHGAPRRRSRRVRAWIACAIGIAVSLVLAELGLRFLLFSESGLAQRLGKKVRHIALYGDLESEEEVWKLQWRFSDKEGASRNDTADPVVGWRGPLTPEFEHPAGRKLDEKLGEKRGQRRLVLLFGDSYAQCTTPAADCWQGLLESSDLGSRYLMLNCGVGGYGLDQIHLLIRKVVPNYLEHDPIVIVGMFLDSDFDRTVLGFRAWPKPRLCLRDGALDYGGPVQTDIDAYLEEHPLEPTCYLWRFLVYGSRVLPWSVRHRLQADQRIEEKRELSKAILEATVADLRGFGVEFFLVGFQGEHLLNSRQEQWQEELLREFARDEGVPVVWSEPFLADSCGGDPQLAMKLCFGRTANMAGHYNPEGNRVVFEALRQGLLGRFEPLDTSAVARTREQAEAGGEVALHRRARLLGEPCTIVWKGDEACVLLGTPEAPSDEDHGTFSARASPGAATVLQWELGPKVKGLRARIRIDGGADPAAGPRITLARDRGTPLEAALADGGRSEALEIDLEGAKVLELRIEPAAGDATPPWIVFEDAKFERGAKSTTSPTPSKR